LIESENIIENIIRGDLKRTVKLRKAQRVEGNFPGIEFSEIKIKITDEVDDRMK